MTIKPIEITRAFEINGAPRLDPIRVILQDLGPGQGRVIIECYGSAWSAYWGATGHQSILQFLDMADADYITSALSSHQRLSKIETAYLTRIVQAVKEAIKTLAK